MHTASIKKSRVQQCFDSGSISYHEVCILQRHIAKDLSFFISDFSLNLNIKPQWIVDIGCGSGFLTQALQEHFFDERNKKKDSEPKFLGLDLSRGMLQHKDSPYQNKTKRDYLSCAQVDFDCLCIKKLSKHVVWGVSSMALHWSSDTKKLLQNLTQQMDYIFFAIPLVGSFGVWNDGLNRIGRLDMVMKLPNLLTIKDYCCEIKASLLISKEKEYTQFFDHPNQYMMHLKKSGTHGSGGTLNHVEICSLSKTLPKPLIINYKIGFFAIKKPVFSAFE